MKFRKVRLCDLCSIVTDYVANGKEQDVVNKYRKQIEIYKRALEEATGNKVFKSYLCLANRDWNCYEVK